MTSAWMGMSGFEEELDKKGIELDGDPILTASFTTWIGHSGLATSA